MAREIESSWKRMIPLFFAVVFALPGALSAKCGYEFSPAIAVFLYATAFVGAALLLAWGTELAQLDLPPGLSIAILAFIAILPEYAVDLLFSFRAGHDPKYAPLALANMTGANRLLIGIGWSLVVFFGYLGSRRRSSGRKGFVAYALQLSPRSKLDWAVLLAVSIYSLNFFFRTALTAVDSLIFFAVFAFYVFKLWDSPQEEPDLIGPPAIFEKFAPVPRRLVTVSLLVAAAFVIFCVADPFTQSLIAAGKQIGVDEFLMVQWIAPFATETAELIPALIFAYRQNADEGLGTLISSKINQWTLLVGGIPIAYAIGKGSLAGIPVDHLQNKELLLTASQSIFALALIGPKLRLSTTAAAGIFLLFAVDFTMTIASGSKGKEIAELLFSALYLLTAARLLLRYYSSRRAN